MDIECGMFQKSALLSVAGPDYRSGRLDIQKYYCDCSCQSQRKGEGPPASWVSSLHLSVNKRAAPRNNHSPLALSDITGTTWNEASIQSRANFTMCTAGPAHRAQIFNLQPELRSRDGISKRQGGSRGRFAASVSGCSFLGAEAGKELSAALRLEVL
ncbi:hypothetical protein EYF80_020602 [Liparis tanakae]|uniref:Uncharacterized protein n=1 Tax=Liparis tanakae TaxID=230148 RepID=A0A4Z2HV12_9TELE|nr:hypothetical protein EYF80_020602 [Liparis tanakae]